MTRDSLRWQTFYQNENVSAGKSNAAGIEKAWRKEAKSGVYLRRKAYAACGMRRRAAAAPTVYVHRDLREPAVYEEMYQEVWLLYLYWGRR